MEILGQANKPEIVQFHLKKLFAGINSVVFEGDKITAVKSVEGEVVSLRNPVAISLDVEVMLFYTVEVSLYQKRKMSRNFHQGIIQQ